MTEQFTVCICGGGNGSHVLAALAASRTGVTVNVLSLYADEAARWSKLLEEQPMSLTFAEGQHAQPEIKSKPTLVTNQVKDALSDADLIVMVVPAFAHAQYFEAMAPHVKKGAAIAGLPGRPGFEFEARFFLKEKINDITLLTYATLPWACRLSEFGRQVAVMGTKESIDGAKQMGQQPAIAAELANARLQRLLGEAPLLKTQGHPLLFSLTSPNSAVHCSIMYGQWKDYNGETFTEAPLFYQGLSRTSAALMSALSDECVAIAKRIQEIKPEVDMSPVKHIWTWYLESYEKEIEDKTDLYSSIRTNRAYTGLVHPMEPHPTESGKLIPNFKYRYLAEDVPCGLLVVKGIAEVIGHPTPTVDMVLLWCQEKLGKEYFVDGSVKGKDVKESRAPQKYGFMKLDDFI